MGTAPMNDAMKTSPGRSTLHDHGWIMGTLGAALRDEFAEMEKFPNRFFGLHGEVYWEALPVLPKDLSQARKDVLGMPQD